MSLPQHDEAAMNATLPTPCTRYLRRSLLFQLWRFTIINLKMLRVIFRSHS